MAITWGKHYHRVTHRRQYASALLGRMITTLLLLLAAAHTSNPSPPPSPQLPLRLHIIEHTHNDVGWTSTIEEYYTNAVRNILDVATQGLAEDSTRRFIYVEVAFFQLWWREQTPQWRAQVQQLVEAGQLEFINAGWYVHPQLIQCTALTRLLHYPCPQTDPVP